MKRVPKQARTKRGTPRPIEITARDESLLLLTALSGHIGIDQLSRALFPSIDRCRRRVRALYNSGYLSTVLVSSTQPNLVRLTKRGLSFLAERQPDVAGRLRLPGPIRLSGIEHHRMVVDMRLFCYDLGALRGTPLLRWSNAGGGWGKELGLDQLGLVPDGLAEFAGRGVVALEADRATEGSQVVAQKLQRYERAAAQGLLEALWVVAVGGTRRQANLTALLEQRGLSDFGWVLPYDAIVERPICIGPEQRAGER